MRKIQTIYYSLFKKIVIALTVPAVICSTSFAGTMSCSSVFADSSAQTVQSKILSLLKKSDVSLGFQATQREYSRGSVSYFTQKSANLIARGISPLPLPRGIFLSPAQKILQAINSNPTKELLPSEQQYLQSRGLLETFQKFQQRRSETKKTLIGSASLKATNALRYAVITYLLVTNGLLFTTYNLDATENAMTFSDYSKEAYAEQYQNVNRLQNGYLPADLLIETTPFPHLALRIKGRVYSYGMKLMTAGSLERYLFDGDSSIMGARAIQVVQLNIKADKLPSLQRFLERESGKVYNNLTYVNDCASMISRALNEYANFSIPQLLDPSPAGVIAYFQSLKILGSSSVREIKTIYPDQAFKYKNWRALKNYWINTMDAKVWAWGVIPNSITRVFMDFYFNEEQSQLSPGMQQERNQQLDEYKKEYRDTPIVAEITGLIQSPTTGIFSEDQLAISEIAESAIHGLEQDSYAISQEPGSDMEMLLRSAAMAEVARELRSRLGIYQEHLKE